MRMKIGSCFLQVPGGRIERKERGRRGAGRVTASVIDAAHEPWREVMKAPQESSQVPVTHKHTSGELTCSSQVLGLRTHRRPAVTKVNPSKCRKFTTEFFLVFHIRHYNIYEQEAGGAISKSPQGAKGVIVGTSGRVRR